MSKPGPKPGGKKTGGRKAGTPNKITEAKRLLLASVEDQFQAAGYDPLESMINLAQKKRLARQDAVKFGFHLALARKFYPDVTAIKVEGRMEHVQAMDEPQRQARIDALLAKRQEPGSMPYADA